MVDLSGKTAIVTGATKGLGHAMAKALAQEGANVVIVSRNAEDCGMVAGNIKNEGKSALACPCDVIKAEDRERLVNKTVETFGGIDILVNNAGISLTIPAEDISEEEWDTVLNTNLKGCFLMAQSVGKQMIRQGETLCRGGGHIINIASMLGLVGISGSLPYLCSKGGVIQLTKGLAVEWAKYGIRVNAIAPGYVVTDMNRDRLEQEKVKESLLRRTPLRRFGQVEEIAEAVVFLASNGSSYMTGSVISIDGGWTAQ